MIKHSLRARFEDADFGIYLQRNVTRLCGELDFEQLAKKLAQLNPTAALQLARPTQIVKIAGRSLDVGPHGQIRQCFSDIILDAGLLETYAGIDSINSLSPDDCESVIRAQCKVNSTLSNSLALLALVNQNGKASVLPDADNAVVIAKQLAQDMLAVLNLPLPQCYFEILSQHIELAIADKSA